MEANYKPSATFGPIMDSKCSDICLCSGLLSCGAKKHMVYSIPATLDMQRQQRLLDFGFLDHQVCLAGCFTVLCFGYEGIFVLSKQTVKPTCALILAGSGTQCETSFGCYYSVTTVGLLSPMYLEEECMSDTTSAGQPSPRFMNTALNQEQSPCSLQ
jgi:hypothetical protein